MRKEKYNNDDILDFCCTAETDDRPYLNITTSPNVEYFDRIIVYARLIDIHLRERLNGAIIRIFDNSEQLLWQGDFGHSASLKYIFDVDFAQCLSSGPTSMSCFNIIPEAVDHETFSQLGQDEMAIEYFGGMRGGFFVDFGANDGKSLSNSYALEKNFGWNGIAIEPLPKHHENLRSIRNCTILNICASNVSGFTKFRVVESNEDFAKKTGFDPDMLSGMVDPWIWQAEVDIKQFSHVVKTMDMYCVRTQEIFDHFNVRHIDYMSVDAEGAELMILQGIEWDRMDITLIHVDFTKEAIAGYLGSKGYRLYQLGHDVCAIKVRRP